MGALHLERTERGPRAPWGIVIFLAAVGVAAVILRVIRLVPDLVAGHSPPASSLDAGFARHPLLTLAHILPGLLFMVLGPLQFNHRLRCRNPRLHRWCGRAFVASGVVIGASALVMGSLMAIGGVVEMTATTLFTLLFLFSLGKGYRHIRRHEVAAHREWMTRAFAVGLAVAATRPIIGVFFATSGLTHLSPHQFFGVAFWIGFTASTLAAEVWIRRTRQTPEAASADTSPEGLGTAFSMGDRHGTIHRRPSGR